MPATAPAEPQMQRLQNAVLQALSEGNQRILVSMLSAGEWSVRGNELVIKIGESQTVVEMSLSSDARRLAIASASGILGRAVKLTVVPGAAVTPQENKRSGGAPRASGPGGRGRAEQDPVVRRMQEKFGAQVRTVIDYKEKR
jgi:DNA polymerase-3 subunit gamma/tau